MNKIIEAIEKYENKDEIQRGMDRLCTNYNSLAPLHYIWSELYFSLPQSLHSLLDEYRSDEPYSLIDYLIMKYGRGERVVKYYFAKQFLDDKNLTCLFEYNVLGSRLDFGRINGYTYAYEIKTENDNLDKLLSQVLDYEKVFDYLYVVIHKKHVKQVKEILSSKVGIMTYNLNGKETEFFTIRRAKQNRSVQKKELIKVFNSSDLTYILKELNSNVPHSIEAKRNLVSRIASKECLFDCFRILLHKKYQSKWNYIVENYERILPIDFQTIYSAGNQISIFRKTQKQQ